MTDPNQNGDGSTGDRLPPPAFPPSSRHRRVSPSGRLPVEAGPGETEGSVPDDAFISPDDADPPAQGGMEEALIPPDAPVVRDGHPEVPDDFEEVMTRIRPEELLTGDVIVTGIGDDPRLDLDPHIQRWGDPRLAQLIAAVTHLGTELEERGEAGLKTRPGMSRFEVTLRAYCVGYLTGLRDQPSETEAETIP